MKIDFYVVFVEINFIGSLVCKCFGDFRVFWSGISYFFMEFFFL